MGHLFLFSCWTGPGELKQSALMNRWLASVYSMALAFVLAGDAQAASIPDALVVDGIPPITDGVKASAGRYLDFRTATFLGWHPNKRSMLISTRFGDVPQLHWVAQPMGARKQLTFSPEPIRAGTVRPQSGNFIVYSQDSGGGEFYQLHRYDFADGRSTLLTDGKSRNSGARFSHSGRWLAFSSTQRNGRDNDLYVMNPEDHKSARKVLEVKGGGWQVDDWSWDDQQLLISEHVSINEVWLYRLEVSSGKLSPLFVSKDHPAAYGSAVFDRDPRFVYWTTDAMSEFQQLFRVEVPTLKAKALTQGLSWDVEEMELSPDSKRIAVVLNEHGNGRLRILSSSDGRLLMEPKLPEGVLGGLRWHDNGRDLGFTLSSARSANDAYSLDVRNGQLTRWTESETGGLDASRFVEPVLVQVKSFDGLQVSGFVYRPDASRFPGKRPVLVYIHGGPESQSRPMFQGRLNYLVNELGIALLIPNVRGSSGFGKTFLTLDNGFKREDSVKDIGAFLDWIGQDSLLDSQRVSVMGGSYGGYMVLACMTHFNDRLKCGIDVVGISNFLTFLKNTQDYRRDLRRVEYGDERDPKMAEFLAKISPLAHVDKIRKPMFLVQGKNDPRVPLSEAEQMVKALKEQGTTVWYLMAKDEGHGFAKKKNVDFQFLATLEFLKQNL